MIHTSCRSESSNISLVVLDKVSLSQNAPQPRPESGMLCQDQPSELVKLLRLSPGVGPFGRSPACLSPRVGWGYVLDPWKVGKTETSASSVPTTAGHLSGEIGTNNSGSPLPPSNISKNIKAGSWQGFHSERGKKNIYLFVSVRKKANKKCLQHHVFPGGHPSKY